MLPLSLPRPTECGRQPACSSPSPELGTMLMRVPRPYNNEPPITTAPFPISTSETGPARAYLPSRRPGRMQVSSTVGPSEVGIASVEPAVSPPFGGGRPWADGSLLHSGFELVRVTSKARRALEHLNKLVVRFANGSKWGLISGPHPFIPGPSTTSRPKAVATRIKGITRRPHHLLTKEGSSLLLRAPRDLARSGDA